MTLKGPIKARRAQMTKYTAFCTVLTSVFLTSCNGSTVVKTQDDQMVVQALKGYQCFLAPDSFNEPGTIFYVGPDRVANFDIIVSGTRQRGDVAIGTVSFQSDTSGSVILGLVKDLLPGLTADANVAGSLTTRRNVSMTPANPGAKEITLSDVKENAIKRVTELSQQGRLEDAKYYVVREAIKASSVSYTLTSGDAQALGAQASLDSVATAKGDVRRTAEGGYQLIQKFRTPLRVCIKPEQIVPKTMGFKGPKDFTTVPVEERIELSGFKGNP